MYDVSEQFFFCLMGVLMLDVIIEEELVIQISIKDIKYLTFA